MISFQDGLITVERWKSWIFAMFKTFDPSNDVASLVRPTTSKVPTSP